MRGRRERSPLRTFPFAVAGAVALGAAIRVAYLVADDRAALGGDGLAYHREALRLADGLGYTSSFGEVGAPQAHHPPGWVTVLGAVSWLGGRSLAAHQVTALVIGLGLIVVVGLVGRRAFGARVGAIAALIAAVYPGFWLLEVHVLSEPLGLLVLGLMILATFELRDRPTVRQSLVVGLACGALALVRSEQLALLVLVVVPVLLRAPGLAPRDRMVRIGAAAATTLVVLAPWTIHNQLRFAEPVLLSTNGGPTLLNGNCPPTTFRGERMGYFDIRCNRALGIREGEGRDRSQMDSLARREALSNMTDHVGDLPLTVLARHGRMLAVFRPGQTVELTAQWFRSDTWPVWAWVGSFWLLVPLAAVGALRARRAGAFLLPFLAPAALVVGIVTVTLGEPRFHSPADLGVVVLAAVACARFTRATADPSPHAPGARDGTVTDAA